MTEEKKPVSKAQQRSVNKYVKENYDRINVTFSKGRKEVIKAFADAQGESVNGFINRAVNAAMNGVQAAGDHAPAPLVTPEQFVKISEHIKRTGETPEEFVGRAIEDTIARDAVSLSIGINPAGK
ncbi:MAG: hypothetical protein MSS54_10485 [Clostridiales bacterium]|nr:hypothetical protein [Clostridiales bacterium]